MKKHQDHKYLVALKNGEPLLLKELYAQFSPQVIQWVKKNNGTIADAKDVFQDALMALYNKACDPDFVLSYPIGGLIFQICKNKWVDQIRKKNNEVVVRIVEEKRYHTEAPPDDLLEAIEEENIRQQKLNTAFKQLSQLCQQLLQLLKEGVSPKEAAATLSMTDSNTVYRRKKACLDRWRSLYYS